MLISALKLRKDTMTGAFMGLPKDYMKERKMKIGEEYIFEFDFEILPLNYIVVCQAFEFGYGEKCDDHHVREARMQLFSAITGSDHNKVKVSVVCEMCDDSKHRMTEQGSDNSYVRVGVIALPAEPAPCRSYMKVSGISSFEMEYEEDHHVKEMYIVSKECDNCKPDAYMKDDSGHKAKGKVFSRSLNIPRELLIEVNLKDVENVNVFTSIRGVVLGNEKKDFNIRQMGFDPQMANPWTLRDSHGNHATESTCFQDMQYLVYTDAKRDGKKETLESIKLVKEYVDKFAYGLYQMEVKYNYSLDRVINSKITDDATLIKAILDETMPVNKRITDINFGTFGCTAFKMECIDGVVRMGRNYDFAQDTSGMLVYCPAIEGGRYASMGFAALNNIWANNPLEPGNVGALAAPFVCLDGVNEKGVAIAVLTLDSPPMRPTDKTRPTIATSLAIRLVLDRAESADHAAKLLEKYNMFASFGRDYHFFIADSRGKALAVEYKLGENREFVALDKVPSNTGEESVRAMTNFFISYIDEVGKETKYGHGKDRYDKVIAFMDEYKGECTNEVAWKALISVVQEPGKSITSNTQWSAVYDLIERCIESSEKQKRPVLKMVFRRHFEDTWSYALGDQEMTKDSGDEWMDEYYQKHKNG